MRTKRLRFVLEEHSYSLQIVLLPNTLTSVFIISKTE